MTFPLPANGSHCYLSLFLTPRVIAVLQDPNSGVFQTETREIETTVRAMG